MKKWFSFAGTSSLMAGAAILGATSDDFEVIQMLAMILLMAGGVFTGLYIADN